jgi:hypothetical protein
MPLPKEQGLVLYRPLGLHADKGSPNVVKQWNGEPLLYDSDRFEEVDDDETAMQEQNAFPAAAEEEVEEDSAMDVD